MTTADLDTPPLQRMSRTTPTVLWNDSADPVELAAAIGWGAVGATCNPVIALATLKADPATWRPRIAQAAAAHPTATDAEIGWDIVKLMSAQAARLLEPAFHSHHGRNGRLSIQTDPVLHRDPTRLIEQAVDFSRLAPNIIVKIPATSAGITAIEEATYRGVSINATVSFTVAQAIAVAEAVERGLNRRDAEGKDTSRMGPVCTIMVGRTDDWIKISADHQQATIDPGYYEWAGIAVFKKAYRIYQERGYRTRLLSAAFRHHMHWSELVGGDIVISPPYSWQTRLNTSGLEPQPRIDNPVDPRIIDTLYDNLAEFRAAYDDNGLTASQFDGYGATRRTLRQFLTANNDLETLIRDTTVPNPDKATPVGGS
jgi:transaldolase